MSVLCPLLIFFLSVHYDEIFSNEQDCLIQTKGRKKEFGINTRAASLPALLLILPSALVNHRVELCVAVENAQKTEGEIKLKQTNLKTGDMKMESFAFYLNCGSTTGPSKCIIHVVQLKQNKK